MTFCCFDNQLLFFILSPLRFVVLIISCCLDKQLLKRHKNHHHTADYQPPTPRDKSHDCQSCHKSFAHKGNLQRHLAAGCGGDLSEDDTASAGSTEDAALRGLTADNVLHGNLMQEWREGKLGNAPQVVIVHPDGRIEEVTPKLQVLPTVFALLQS
jgi:hypothetical protein